MDLLFFTELTPASIIWGKLSSALVLTLLLFTASLPFMTLTYMLRGLDIPSMFIMLGLDFLVVAASIQLGILFGSLPGGLISRGFRLLMGLALLSSIFSATMATTGQMLFSGIGTAVGSWEFWAAAGTTIGFIVMSIGLMFVVSTTTIAPASSNKSVLPRLYLLGMWALTGLMGWYWSGRTRDWEYVFVWAFSAVVVFSLLMFISTTERLNWAARVRRKIPLNRILRVPAFLLYSGAAGGIFYSVAMIAATTAALTALNSFTAGPSVPEDEFLMVLGVGLYAFCYAMTAFAIRNSFFPKSIKPGVTIAVALVLVMGGTFVPLVVGMMLRANPWERLDSSWYVGNPVALFLEGGSLVEDCLMLTGIWAAIVAIINAPSLVKQITAFKPLQPATTQTEPANE
jgi:hypothetical protein